MTHPNRIDGVGRVRRGKALKFTFNGRQYFGFEGDTLASALLANNVHLVGRSFKYHRPRGIFSAGPEEPNAIVQLETGAYTEPNTRVTVVELYDGLVATSQNCWPSVRYDVGALNSILSRFMPAGFYYKTFMWPASMWMTYEHFIRKAAGLGRTPRQPDPDRYEQVYAYCDVLVVGAGAAGISAALAAAPGGARVILMDEQAEPGGYLLSSESLVDGFAAIDWIKQSMKQLESFENVRVVTRCTVAGYYEYNYLTAVERVTDHLNLADRQSPAHKHKPRQKFWKIRAKQVVLATGAIERPMLFADNDRPGVMLASSVRTYIRRYCVLPASAFCVFTNNDSAYATACDILGAGGEVTVVDTRVNPSSQWVSKALEAGVNVMSGSAVTGVIGKSSIRAVEVHRLTDDGKGILGDSVRIPCQVIAASGGLNPTVHLHSQSQGKLEFCDAIGAFVPVSESNSETNAPLSAGACNGTFALALALTEGQQAGHLASNNAGYKVGPIAPSTAVQENSSPLRHLWVIPTTHAVGVGPRKHFHDQQNDVTVADIHLAAREGYLSVEHLKRYTTTGMGTDQGKTSNVNALAILADVRGMPIPEVGTTTFRPPYTPVTFGAITGQNRQSLFLQIRKTPMHLWHVQNGAVFEDVGDWKRARYYPQRVDGQLEDMHAAVQRECYQTRQSVGMVDASTLGKIDIQGKDAAEFLSMVYTNGWMKLGIAQCRYGLMLNEHGMVFDDGVTTRLAEHHYHMTTTTGGAARVLNWLEEWLQTEWPEKEVFCTSVTEQWAVVALNGPDARELLAGITEIDLGDDAFPHMSCQSGQVAGVDARIYRISFTGELSYEINVPARFGLYLWESLICAGQAYDLCVYGTEAMHVLRAEKGFVIVGQDTDGTVTPYDLGMAWIVNNSKPDFLGKRSLSRSDTSADGRKQLVGIITENQEVVLPEGAHLLESPSATLPAATLGHVTSSYMSPNVGRAIAMALVKDGQRRIGDNVVAALMDGSFERVRIVEPMFYPEKTEAGDALPVSEKASEKLVEKLEIFETHSLMGITPARDATEKMLNIQARVVKIVIRGKPDNSGFFSEIENTLNIELPVIPNTVNGNRLIEALWLGPDEWLIRSCIESTDSASGSVDSSSADSTSAGDLALSIQRALSGNHNAVVDVSDYYCVLELDTCHALAILEKVTPLDTVSALPDTSWCAQTRIGNAPVLLSRAGESDEIYRLQVRWSYTEYLWDYISEAAMEYQGSTESRA